MRLRLEKHGRVFFAIRRNQGVHFQLSLQISEGGGETAEFTDSLRISGSLWTQKVAVEKRGENAIHFELQPS